MAKSHLQRISEAKDADELFDDPTAFGLPTIEEFIKNQDKWVGRDDDGFSQVDKGGDLINKYTQRHRYEIEGYSCKTLEEVEKVARSQGINIKDLDYRPQVMPQGAGKCDLLIKFVSKSDRLKRNKWS
jgi:hypothetical protein